MELIKVKKVKDKIVINLKVGETPFMSGEKQLGNVVQHNEITFDGKELAESYFKSVYDDNCNALDDKKRRLEQMDSEGLNKVNEFVEVVERTGTLSKRNSTIIENLLTQHNQMRTFVKEIEELEDRRDINKKIIDSLEKL